MPYYPALLDLTGRRVLLVGGGGSGRAQAGQSFGGRGVGAPGFAGAECSMPGSAGSTGWEYLARGFEPSDFGGVCLAVSATDDPAVNRAVADEAGRRNIFVNVVDVPELCSFIVPAHHKAGGIVHRGQHRGSGSGSGPAHQGKTCRTASALSGAPI